MIKLQDSKPIITNKNLKYSPLPDLHIFPINAFIRKDSTQFKYLIIQTINKQEMGEGVV